MSVVSRVAVNRDLCVAIRSAWDRAWAGTITLGSLQSTLLRPALSGLRPHLPFGLTDCSGRPHECIGRYLVEPIELLDKACEVGSVAPVMDDPRVRVELTRRRFRHVSRWPGRRFPAPGPACGIGDLDGSVGMNHGLSETRVMQREALMEPRHGGHSDGLPSLGVDHPWPRCLP